MIFDKITIMSTISSRGKGFNFCVLHSPPEVSVPSRNCWNWGINPLSDPSSRLFKKYGYFCQSLISHNSYNFDLGQKIIHTLCAQFLVFYIKNDIFIFWKNSEVEKRTLLGNFVNILYVTRKPSRHGLLYFDLFEM